MYPCAACDCAEGSGFGRNQRGVRYISRVASAFASSIVSDRVALPELVKPPAPTEPARTVSRLAPFLVIDSAICSCEPRPVPAAPRLPPRR